MDPMKSEPSEDFLIYLHQKSIRCPSEDFLIDVLLWVDDVVSCREGKINQEQMLNKLAEFAIKHKLKWGQAKCKVMKVGKHCKTT